MGAVTVILVAVSCQSLLYGGGIIHAWMVFVRLPPISGADGGERLRDCRDRRCDIHA